MSKFLSSTHSWWGIHYPSLPSVQHEDLLSQSISIDFPWYVGLSKNNGTPKSSILIGFSIIFTIHFGGPPLFGNTHATSSHVFSPQNPRVWTNVTRHSWNAPESYRLGNGCRWESYPQGVLKTPPNKGVNLGLGIIDKYSELNRIFVQLERDLFHFISILIFKRCVISLIHRKNHPALVGR